MGGGGVGRQVWVGDPVNIIAVLHEKGSGLVAVNGGGRGGRG